MEMRTYAAASGTISAGCRASVITLAAGAMSSAHSTLKATDSTSPRWMPRDTAGSSRAPTAWATIGSSANSVPIAKTMTLKK